MNTTLVRLFPVTTCMGDLVATAVQQRSVTNDRFQFGATPISPKALPMAFTSPHTLTYEVTLRGYRAGILVSNDGAWRFMPTSAHAPRTNPSLPNVLSAIAAAFSNNDELDADTAARIDAWALEHDTNTERDVQSLFDQACA